MHGGNVEPRRLCSKNWTQELSKVGEVESEKSGMESEISSDRDPLIRAAFL